MKEKIARWQWLAFFAVGAGGTLLHFVYDWTGRKALAAIFAAVNESTWEHMKLLYFPMLAVALVQRRAFKETAGFWCVKLLGTLVGLTLIPVLFYTVNGAFGKSPDWVNISIFFVSAAAALALEARLFRRGVSCPRPRWALAALLMLGVCFAVFTFFPPRLPLFAAP